jgi:F0F1-type ATP synthase assembly protein I
MGKNVNTPKTVLMFALATSVIFELMAGPFMGYFTGLFLTDKLGAPPLAMPISVFAGFALSFYAAFITIMKINKANDTPPDA